MGALPATGAGVSVGAAPHKSVTIGDSGPRPTSLCPSPLLNNERNAGSAAATTGRADATANAFVVPAVSGAGGVAAGTTEGAAVLAATAVGRTFGVTLARATWKRGW